MDEVSLETVVAAEEGADEKSEPKDPLRRLWKDGREEERGEDDAR